MLNIDALNQLEMSKVGPVQSTVRETSYDDKNNEYMVTMPAPAFDMDAAMRSYVESLPGQDGCPRSIDALLCGANGNYYLLEFKNGSVKKDEVLNKLYATLLMLQDVCSLSLDDARSDFVFVLVYDKAKLGGQGNGTGSSDRRVNDARYFGRIRHNVARHAKTDTRSVPKRIRGMGNSIKNIFVKDYICCDRSDFEDVLSEALVSR